MIKFAEIEKYERPDVDERSYDDMDTLYELDYLTSPKNLVDGHDMVQNDFLGPLEQGIHGL